MYDPIQEKIYFLEGMYSIHELLEIVQQLLKKTIVKGSTVKSLTINLE